MKYSPIIIAGLIAMILSGCGKNLPTAAQSTPSLPPVGIAADDGSVVHGRAVVVVSNEQQTAMMKLFKNFLMPSAYAANGSSTVTYTNVGSTNFTINVAALTASGFTGNTLNLGSVALATISDNNLKVCGTGGATKCGSAAIRVYTTGSTAGFVNTADGYGAPVYTGSMNPSSQVGLLDAGSVQVQALTIPSNKHTVALADFPTPTYAVTADFSNAGAGSYSMTYVVEYVLNQ